jgi:RNA polymerase sigma-70 factor (ECF subfamily)
VEQLELIKSAASGDQDSFKELVKFLEPAVASTVIGMLGNCQEAADVGQETFIRFYKALKNFRGDSNVKTYVTRIAINLSLNEIKRQQRRRVLFAFDNKMSDKGSEDVNIKKQEIMDMVQHALSQLKPKFRAVVVLRLIDGYSVRETGEILDIPEGTVLSRFSRAQKRLRKLLSPMVKGLL